MNSLDFTFRDARLTARPSGALFWAEERALVVSDLHLGKSERIARRGGALLPPYDTIETLTRLSADVEATRPWTVICLGDSFDDLAAAKSVSRDHVDTLARLQAGRRWVWIEGNHDPRPVDLGGEHLVQLRLGPLTFRHIAEAAAEPGEVSGHYHPKARVRHMSRPCFMRDADRLILPAYGCYTGGLDWTTPVLRALFAAKAVAYLTGARVLTVPVPAAA
ncbi:MAG: ligase-associated DNA damage response endonuclease PdeM [Pseudomonadota bacterium]